MEAIRVTENMTTGTLLARKRLEELFDTGSFTEIGAEVRHRQIDFGLDRKRPRGDGVVTGFGSILGHRVYAYSQDRTVFGGTLGEAHAEKIVRILDLALRHRAPVVCINDSGGARIQEGVDALTGYGAIFYRHVRASGIIPQIAVIAGACAGGAAYGPALCDFIVMVHGSTMFLTGPRVVEAVCNEFVTSEELGGTNVHSERTGLAHFVAASDTEAFQHVRQLIRMLKDSVVDAEPPPLIDPGTLVPLNPRQVYDVRRVITAIVDRNSFFEIQKRFAPNLVIGLARMNGIAVGIVANNPARIGGVLDTNASRKGARFVRFCDRFRIPIVTLIDVPGFLPGLKQERENVIGHGARLLYAYSEATVPKISVVLRKAYGGAFIVMNSKVIGGDFYYAWPQAELAVMGKRGAAEILYRKEILGSADPAAMLLEKEEEYARKMLNVVRAAERGHVDAIIEPRDTRRVIVASLMGIAPSEGLALGNIQL